MKAATPLPIGKALRGWGVIRPSPYHFLGLYRTKTEAEVRALAMGDPEYLVSYGAQEIGTENFFASE
jgi:hypothetical protein